MTGWDDLVSAAIVGSATRQPDLKRLDPPLTDYRIDTDPADAAGGLLDVAALFVAGRRAGVRFASAENWSAASPPAPETHPLIGTIAAEILALAANRDLELTEQLLTLTAERGLRIRGWLLPTLLAKATQRRSLRPALWQAAGARGPWLAAQNPAWHGLLASAPAADQVLDEQVWSHGSEVERVTWLTQLRGSDPARALSLLTHSWASEPAAARLNLLQCLEISLSESDEVFLESVLDDRRSEVREQAVRLLRQLPRSQRGHRMIERASRFVQRNGADLQVGLPAEFDASWARDQLKEKAAKGDGGGKFWLRQILTETPLSFWAQVASEPGEVIALAVRDENAVVLIAALQAATVHQRSADWARALLRGLPPTDDDAALVALLPVAQREQHVLAGSLSPDLLRICPEPWSPVLADGVLSWLIERAADGRRSEQATVLEVVELAALRLPTEQTPHDYLARLKAVEDYAGPASPILPRMRRAAESLLLRRRFLEELR